MGKIKVTTCEIEGLCVIEPTVFKDERGYFMETYNQNDFKEAGLDMVFVQDNQSMSTRGVLRGLHYQKQFRRESWFALFAERYLMLQLICVPVLRPMESGLAWS